MPAVACHIDDMHRLALGQRLSARRAGDKPAGAHQTDEAPEPAIQGMHGLHHLDGQSIAAGSDD